MHDIHTKFLRQSIDLARQARDAGNHPFGSVLILADGRIVNAVNTVVSDNDCTCHAEMNAIKSALRHGLNLDGATVYASTEPCAMCAGAIYWAGISRVVFGCSTARLGKFTGGSLVIPCASVLEKGTRRVEIMGPLLEEEAATVHEGFWG